MDLWTQDCVEKQDGSFEARDYTRHVEVTWDASGSGSGTSDPPSDEIAIPPVPDWPWEYCDKVRADWAIGNTSFHFARSAQTTIELHTGGKSIAGEKNLIAIGGGVTGRGVDCALFGGPTRTAGQSCFDYYVDPTTVYFPGLGKSLGNNGQVYTVLADNQIIDVTPTVAGQDFYHFHFEPSKHRPILTANGVEIRSDFAVEDAEFCTGQKVVFRLEFLPQIDFKKSETMWNLPSKFVNSYEEVLPETESRSLRVVTTCHPKRVYASGYEFLNPKRSRVYSVDETLLEQPETGAWWLSGGQLKTTCLKKLFFQNGQSVSILKSGNIFMFRPSVTNIKIPSGGSPTFGPYWDTFVGIPARPGLTLGGPHDPFPSGTHDMRFEVHYYIGKFPGTAGLTQLVIADYSYDTAFQFSDWRLDGDTEYYKATSISLATPFNMRFVDFFDAPQNAHPVPIFPVRVKAQFKVYCRFTPSGSDNISVTLALLNWSCHGELHADWTVDPNSAIAPTNPPQDSDEFPYWERVRSE